MMRTRLIVFDLDGTLVDSFPGIQAGLNLALSDLGLPHRNLAWVRRHVGRGASRLIAAAAGKDGIHDTLMAAFRHHYSEVLTDATQPYPGVDEALAVLAVDHTLAIASNKPLHWVEELVNHLGWRWLMASVVGPETTGTHKPHPAMIGAILEKTGHSVAESLLVGDMPVDAETGDNAGMPVVGVATGSCLASDLRAAGCVDVISGVSELPRWLETRRLG
jgi:phosphoglycolate phosphatase